MTLSTGVTQFKMESDSVPRHLGQHKASSGKETYGIFIAQSINAATLAHFYVLHHTSVKFYGGNAKIIPLKLKDFKRMLEIANQSDTKPTAATIKAFVETATVIAKSSEDEEGWYKQVQELTYNWV